MHRLERAGRVVHGEFRPGGVEREWCDAGVLRSLRRRSLAALRHEVEPVDATTFVRFLAAWQGVGRGRRGTDALIEAIEQLQGVAVPASVLERDVLPARVEGYRPAMLDELCAAGELVWIGAGALGADDGRVRLFFRDRVRLLASSVVAPEPPSGELHDTIRAHLRARGRVVLARSRHRRRHGRRGPAPHRALGSRVGRRGHQRHVRPTARSPPGERAPIDGASGRIPAGSPGSVRPRARAGGRSWRRSSIPRPPPTEVAHAIALQLLERHGVVTREAVRAEGTPGGFAGVYPVLRALEEAGRARRGWFVAGLGAAEFALPGAVDRLRAHRTPVADDPGRVAVLAATDPAQPYGAALELARARGRRAAVAGGRRSCRARRRRLRRLPRARRAAACSPSRGAPDDDLTGAWADALVEAHKEGRLGRLQIERIDDEPARTSQHAARLRAAGFADGYKGLTLHR